MIGPVIWCTPVSMQNVEPRGAALTAVGMLVARFNRIADEGQVIDR